MNNSRVRSKRVISMDIKKIIELSIILSLRWSMASVSHMIYAVMKYREKKGEREAHALSDWFISIFLISRLQFCNSLIAGLVIYLLEVLGFLLSVLSPPFGCPIKAWVCETIPLRVFHFIIQKGAKIILKIGNG